jgi:two-component system response regulator AtoC
MKYRIFVVDDDQQYARMLSYRLSKNTNYDVTVYNRGEAVIEQLAEQRPDVILLDIMMPGIDGIEVLQHVVKVLPKTPVIMVSAQGVIDTAVEAMKIGAHDYITKGQDDLVKLDTIVRNAIEKVTMTREIDSLRDEVSSQYKLQGLIGDSEPMNKVYNLIQKAVRGDLTVAIQGESGTGKELVARAIHYNSNRRRKPFVVVNCAAIPRELMESEFFGHEKGSFTGAHARKIGKFEAADQGTISLDEIGELDLDLQAKLLRTLQEGELTRVGGNETIEFDARVISATNADVIQMIRDGRFREDLYYRLYQFPVPLPPLRNRGSDIMVLSNYFFREYLNKHPEFKETQLSIEAQQAIKTYSWPGNVRELKSAIERAILIADEDQIRPEDLMLDDSNPVTPWSDRPSTESVRQNWAPSRVAEPTRQASAVTPQPYVVESSTQHLGSETLSPGSVDETDSGEIVSLEELKHRAVRQAFQLFDGNVDRAAVELGIGRATMYRLLKKYHLMS